MEDTMSSWDLFGDTGLTHPPSAGIWGGGSNFPHPNANQELFSDSFSESFAVEHTHLGPWPLPPENSYYVDEDENLMLPPMGVEYSSAVQRSSQPFDLDVAAQAYLLGDIEAHHVNFSPVAQMVHTQLPGLRDGDIAPFGTPPGGISPNQAPDVPQRTATSSGRHSMRPNCHECGYAAESISDLSWHGERSGHAPFRCQFSECESTFSRFDVMIRHQKRHDDLAPRHPCQHCRKYRGSNGFKREDHLRQHMRNYHHIELPFTGSVYEYLSCPKAGCPEYRQRPSDTKGPDRPFDKKSDYTEHMRKVHNESPYPCDVPGCDRIDGKGFFRRTDLKKHKAKKHTDNAE